LAIGVCTQLTTTVTTIIATAVLYNILKQQNDEMLEDKSSINDKLLNDINIYPTKRVGNLVSGHN